MTLQQAETDIDTSIFIVVSPPFCSNRTGPVLATWDIRLDKRDCEERETEEKREVPGKQVRAWLLGRDTLAQSASAPGMVSVMLDIEIVCKRTLSVRLANAPSSALAKREVVVLTGCPSPNYTIYILFYKYSKRNRRASNHRSALALIPLENLFSGRDDILMYKAKSSSASADASGDSFEQVLTDPVVVSLQRRPGPENPQWKIPPAEWQSVLQRIDQGESLRAVACDYNVSYEAVRRVIQAARKQNAHHHPYARARRTPPHLGLSP